MTRIDRILDKMTQHGLDYLLVTDPHAIKYIIGYDNDPHERMYMMVLSTKGNHQLFFNQLFFVDRDLGLPITWFDDGTDALTLIADYIKDGRVIGVDKNIQARWLLPLMNSVEATFVLGSACVDEVRAVKDPEEQAIMFRASEINDLAMEEIRKLLATDKTEAEMGDELLKVYRSLDAIDHSFEPIFGYGANGADPHHVCDDTRLKPGDSIICDVGCVYQGYCSDMTRTFFYKEVSDKQRYVYNLVLKAQLAAEDAIKPGVKLCDIDAIARNIITEGGYGPEFNHRLGHFIGQDVHEQGEASPVSQIIAEEGMIFSVEPGVYIEGEFGVRIEDLVMVTHDGCKRLNNYPKELTIID